MPTVTIRSGSLLADPEPLNTVEPGWGHVLRIWWALLWRSGFALSCGLLLGAAASFASAIVLGMIAAILKLPPGVVDRVAHAFATLLAVIVVPVSSLVALRTILNKDFQGFSLVLLERR